MGAPTGPALTEEEFRMASGAFDAAKYEEYNRQVRVDVPVGLCVGAMWWGCSTVCP